MRIHDHVMRILKKTKAGLCGANRRLTPAGPLWRGTPGVER